MPRVIAYQSTTSIGGAPYIINGTSIAVGTTSGAATAAGTRAIAIGTSASASNTDSIAIGHSLTASGLNSIIIGARQGSSVSGNGAILIGSNETITQSANDSIGIGGPFSNGRAPANTVSIMGRLTSTSAVNSTIFGGSGLQNVANSVNIGYCRSDFGVLRNKDVTFCHNLFGLNDGGCQYNNYSHANNPYYPDTRNTCIAGKNRGMTSNTTSITHRNLWPNGHIEHSNVIIGMTPRIFTTATTGQLGPIRTFALQFGTTGVDTVTLQTDFVPDATAALVDATSNRMLLIDLGGVNYKIPLYT